MSNPSVENVTYSYCNSSTAAVKDANCVFITRQELSVASGMSDGGGLSNILSEIEACGLIGHEIFLLTKPVY